MAGGEDATGEVLEELDRDECLRLLATEPVGRVAVGWPGQAPLVLPVNHVLAGGAVVFRTGHGDKLRGLGQGPVSFEVDTYDPATRTGWSVLVHGIADRAQPEDVAHLELEPWAPGDKEVWVRIVPAIITGRRVRHGPA
jgi:uncharacterized protein